MAQGAERKRFMLFQSCYESIMVLPDQQRLAIYDAIFKYIFTGDIPIAVSRDDTIVKAMFVFIKPALDNKLKKSDTGSNGAKNRQKPYIDHNESRHDGFDEFWEVYPRKVGKSVAKKAWDKIKPTAEFQAKILDAIACQKKSLQWQRDNGQYIPHPTTWLNQERWDDEPLKRGRRTNRVNFSQREYSDDFFEQFVTSDFGGT